ncbi:MAG: 3-deoxy-manno-octulosonate cytidylyltransferase [Thermoflexibacter sp.]|jgi:3-deoxy-manno-octulosonate cytidylyltransferase (CMP-KDO synthetase)|nr:3-deoxy-manno-octulosonate cytidylyltransferase [Thermoflexibacter sp.]
MKIVEKNILGIIPARYASTRFPAKMLADIQGKPMIQHVYERASEAKCLDKLVVATDNQNIVDVVKGFGGEVVLTREDHPSGTDRCHEALEIVRTTTKIGYDYVINIQGDEPFISPEQIELLASKLDGQTEIATLIIKALDMEKLFNVGEVKVVLDKDENGIYFSRQVIPFLRNIPQEDWLKYHIFYRHVGMYAYRADVLAQITQLTPSLLEKAESLEQLRWIENGFKIKTAITEHDSYCVDTPEDLANLLSNWTV